MVLPKLPQFCLDLPWSFGQDLGKSAGLWLKMHIFQRATKRGKMFAHSLPVC